MLDGISRAGEYVDAISNLLPLRRSDKLRLLNCVDLRERVDLLLRLFHNMIQQQRQRTLVGGSRNMVVSRPSPITQSSSAAVSDELKELKERIEKTHMSDNVRKVVEGEVKRIMRMSASHVEYSVSLNYLDWILCMPWPSSPSHNNNNNNNNNNNSDQKSQATDIDIDAARARLEADHFGIHTVKQRIIEHLSVLKLRNQDITAPIICLVGPPGVGKTSLGRSISQAMNRKFWRVSLGGVRDVADIKGHRRTYVASMPGLIIQALKSVKSDRAVILLDEIDKVGRDGVRGDPASALLEVLDPEQNSSFTDHYLNVPFDLSKIVFIATANSLETISRPLLDRMEVVRLDGYTIAEKSHIASRFILKKQMHKHGIEDGNLSVSHGVMEDIVDGYTREPGVRSLERHIAKLCRHVAMQLAALPESERKNFRFSLTKDNLTSVLGHAKFSSDSSDAIIRPGIVCGLSYTASGTGSILYIETAYYRGTGKLHLTGKLGDVIKESVMTVMSWIRAHQPHLDIDKSLDLNGVDVHVHFPAGAVAKDGPSAGIAILTALVSLFSGPVCRSDTAMTGEFTLTGKVLPVGGIKEKVMAAHRAGIRRVILPFKNRFDVVQDVPEDVKRDMEFISVTTAEDVLRHVFVQPSDERAKIPQDLSAEKPISVDSFSKL